MKNQTACPSRPSFITTPYADIHAFADAGREFGVY